MTLTNSKLDELVSKIRVGTGLGGWREKTKQSIQTLLQEAYSKGYRRGLSNKPPLYEEINDKQTPSP